MPEYSSRCNALRKQVETTPTALAEMLRKNGISVKTGVHYENALHIKGSSNLAETEMFKVGLFHVQDESSMLAVKLLDP